MNNRTWLFSPGHDRQMLKKALASSADVVIADWEDAVPAELKSEAREITREVFTATKRPHGRTAIRINSVESPEHMTDANALEDIAVDVVLLAKSETAQSVRGIASLPVTIVPLVETARGVDKIDDLAKAHPKVECLAFGSLDFAADVGVPGSTYGDLFKYVRSRLVVTSRSSGLQPPIDGICPMLNDPVAIQKETETARDMGFRGKLAIHPKQLAIIEQAFSPTQHQVTRAQRIVEAAHRAGRQGKSVIQLDGEMIDRPIILWAHSILAESVLK